MEAVTLTYDVPVPMTAAFYLFVQEIDQWWPSVFTHDPAHYRSLTIEGHLGGGVVTQLDHGEVVWGEVIEWDPPELVAWQQWWRQTDEFPSVVTARFTQTENGSRLHFEHGGWHALNIRHRQRFIEWPLILSHYVAHARAHARGVTFARQADRGVA